VKYVPEQERKQRPFEVLIGLHSADQKQTTLNQHSAARKKQKHQQWHPHRIQFVFFKGFMEQHWPYLKA
jgi:hypothetical protein